MHSWKLYVLFGKFIYEKYMRGPARTDSYSSDNFRKSYEDVMIGLNKTQTVCKIEVNSVSNQGQDRFRGSKSLTDLEKEPGGKKATE